MKFLDLQIILLFSDPDSAVISGFILFLMLCVFIFIIINKSYKNQQKFIIEKAEMETRYLQQVLIAQEEMRENILAHVSREMHDNMGQIISLIKVNLQTAKLDKDVERSKRVLNETGELVKQLAIDIKEFSASLHHHYLTGQTIEKIVEIEVNRLNKMDFLRISYAHEGEETNMDGNTVLFLYRIFQEMINNTLKHSEATEVMVNSSYHHPVFSFSYKDNGKGFDYEQYLSDQTISKSSGLQNIMERCRLIGADFSVNSIPDLGTQMTITKQILL